MKSFQLYLTIMDHFLKYVNGLRVASTTETEVKLCLHPTEITVKHTQAEM